jgi:quercetin dioxygenase-like cupin family protein
MRSFLETVTPEAGESWAFLDRGLSDGIPFEWHQHPEYELTLTLNSRGHRYVGHDVELYDDGDLVLIGPGIPHSWHSREAVDATRPHVALVMWFTRE